MPNPEQVIWSVWGALRPGGRFVPEFGGYGNVASIVGALSAALVARHIAPSIMVPSNPAHYCACSRSED